MSQVHAIARSTADIRRAAQGQWLSILASLCPELDTALARPGRHSACPVHGGKDGFRLFRDAPVSGGGVCNTCGPRPDGFALLMWLKDWPFPSALSAVSRVLNGEAVAERRHRVAVPVDRSRDDAKRRALLRRVWSRTIALSDPGAELARRYLIHRGLAVDTRASLLPLGFHPCLRYQDDDGLRGYHPALLALVSDANGQPVTIHRTFLSPDGRKAALPHPKRLMAYPSDRQLPGGAVRLGPPAARLGIAEGIETALAVHQATGMTVWAALTCALLERFIPPPNTEQVLIWADHDANGAGQTAAKHLHDRLSEQGLSATIRIPPEAGMDWLDVRNDLGLRGFQSMENR